MRKILLIISLMLSALTGALGAENVVPGSAQKVAQGADSLVLKSGDLVVEEWVDAMAWSASCPGYRVYIVLQTTDELGVFPYKKWVEGSCYVLDETAGLEYDLVAGEVTIELTELGSRWMHGTAQTADEVVFVLDLYSPAAMRYDEQRENYEAYFAVSEVQVDDSKWEEFGGLTLLCQNKKNQVAAISFVCDKDSADADIMLPLGEYTVSDSRETYTVTPSVGVYGEVYSSFAGTVSRSGIDYPVWLIEDGKVTVSKENGEPRVTVEALNSCMRKISIQIGGRSEEGIEEVRSEKREVRKEMREGRVVIVSGESVYEVNGARE